MDTGQTDLQPLFNTTVQYVIPLFQRPYSWDKKQLAPLWEDIKDLLSENGPTKHFLGPIITKQVSTNPQNVRKHLVIDGQQRLTTLSILLLAIRDRYALLGDVGESDAIHRYLCTNDKRNIHETEVFKILPSQPDRKAYAKLVNRDISSLGDLGKVGSTYSFFQAKLRQFTDVEQLKELKDIVLGSLILVTISLSEHDNPYMVFESLNSKGLPLTAADLIKNHIFMQLHADKQESAYEEFWRPVETALGDEISEFFRHYLMSKTGTWISSKDLYERFRIQAQHLEANALLREILQHHHYYLQISRPLAVKSDLPSGINSYLVRLSRLETQTTYPFLMTLLDQLKNRKISESEVEKILDLIENHVVRVFSSFGGTGLNKEFPVLCQQAANELSFEIVEKEILHKRSFRYPSDDDIKRKMLEQPMYSKQNRKALLQFILEELELKLEPKETVDFAKLTLEHVFPQNPSVDWLESFSQEELEEMQDYLHCIGNITLTGYNPEMGNDSFTRKREFYLNSNVALNGYFEKIETWDPNSLRDRGEYLTGIFLERWPNRKKADNEQIETRYADAVTGSKPKLLQIGDVTTDVRAWSEVWITTFQEIWNEAPEQFEALIEAFPNFVSRSKSDLRNPRELQSSTGIYVEMNFSARSIYKNCQKVIDFLDWPDGYWEVLFE